MSNTDEADEIYSASHLGHASGRRRSRARRRQNLTRLTLSSVLLAVVSALAPIPAEAIDPTCQVPDQQYNVAASKDMNQHRSVRVWKPGMLTQNGNIRCARVSSVFLFINDTKGVELGWADINWANNPQSAPCNVFSGSVPRRFYFYRDSGTGAEACFFGSTETANDDYHWFRIANGDFADGIYDFYVDGVYWTSTANLSFKSGIPITNGERDGRYAQDGPNSDFDYLQYETWNGWFDWTATDVYPVAFPDPDYHNFIVTCRHVRVRLGAEYDNCP